MRFPDPFSAPGRWYKGNLHTHTSRSDGRLDPEETVRRYREAGYDFLALTDHNTITEIQSPSDDFLLLLGVELDGDRADAGEAFHIVSFGLDGPGPVPSRPTIDHALAWTRERGGEAILAHPYWSGLVLCDMLRCSGCLGVEVFNTGCHFDLAKGYSSVHWDDALGRGMQFWGFAVDDSHHGDSGRRPTDTARAWVMVKAQELTREAILGAIREGLFYSSWGPAIHDIALEDGVLSVRCSPVREISFIAQRWAGESNFAMQGPTIEGASYTLRGHEDFVRVECRDTEGRCAWSNPLFPRE